MWACTELDAHGINTDRTNIGVVPFGTGNDFARTFLWGGKPPNPIIGEGYKGLKVCARKWYSELDF